ncbi:MAG TPA: hypothetical protein VFN25_07920 [Dokdonella sp.]|uniref:hypothetical protein n=1 Tax=Dokdonella sp. TaxID=2291710 RepID=UPI002D80A1F9|nr:hypothetical protein [Dokdonella sp.]HET9032816.1 hypothetical protein [Dokdonella sp.]
MIRILSCQLPDNAYLLRYRDSGAYTDCYQCTIDSQRSHADFVMAFYTTWLFKLERKILAWAVNRPSTDAQAMELAQGQRDRFAAWDVECRSLDQLLLRDLHGRTRSWLMTTPIVGNSGTRLYFGSAVVPRADPTAETASPGFPFRALLGFHKIYSRCLLRAACAKLRRQITL